MSFVATNCPVAYNDIYFSRSLFWPAENSQYFSTREILYCTSWNITANYCENISTGSIVHLLLFRDFDLLSELLYFNCDYSAWWKAWESSSVENPLHLLRMQTMLQSNSHFDLLRCFCIIRLLVSHSPTRHNSKNAV